MGKKWLSRNHLLLLPRELWGKFVMKTVILDFSKKPELKIPILNKQ
jgi:hypothetical protein